MRAPKIKPHKVIDQKVITYFEGEKELLKKVGLKKRLVVLFPRRRYGAPSLLGAFILFILRKMGGILDTEFTLIDKEK